VSSWLDLVTASLIGTERSVVPPTEIPGVLTGDPGTVTQDPAAVLLDRAALLTAARRAGQRPGQAEPLPVAEPDYRPAVSQVAGHRLARILGGEYPDLLAEWLTAAMARGRALPPQLLPALLDRARRAGPADPALPRLVAEAGGARARWLAGLNPDWEFVRVQDLPGDDAWRLGTAAQRRGYLAALLARDPDAARDLITDSWEAAGPGERTMFLAILADGPAPADEPLLDAALGDGAEDVRAWAAYLLARLPGSALGQRMSERALACVRLHRGDRGTRLVIVPPVQSDASMRRDGIAPGSAARSSSPAGSTHLLLEVLARTSLRTWSEEFRMSPAQVVALPAGGWDPVLFTGWARAAIAQRDQDWMAALLHRALTGHPPETATENEAVRQLARRADPLLGSPVARADLQPGAPPAVREAVRVLRFRYEMLKELGDDHDGD
jgi:hypothetical protein